MFSIVIPLYNKAHTIKRTLKTVFAQTYSVFEILIVNDGSTDNWLEIIQPFITDSRIRIIDQENLGVSAARNKGVACAKYDYIAFLDGDDEWMPDYLLKIMQAIKLLPDAGLYCSAGIIRNADGSHNFRIAEKYIGKIVEIDFFQNPHIFLHTSATIVSKKVFFKTEGFPIGMKKNEDFAFFYSLALITQVVYSGFPLSVYVGGVMGQATSIPSESLLNHVVNRYNLVFFNWVKTGCINKTFKQFLKYELRHELISKLRNSDYKSITFIISNLNPGLLNWFSSIELRLIQNKLFKYIMIFYILNTKLKWRLNGFPRHLHSNNKRALCKISLLKINANIVF